MFLMMDVDLAWDLFQSSTNDSREMRRDSVVQGYAVSTKALSQPTSFLRLFHSSCTIYYTQKS